MFYMFFIILLPFLLVSLSIILLKMLFYYAKYNKSNYKYESGVSFFKFYFNTGCFGEGLTFFKLEALNHYSKIMSNLYIPTENNETTEIDLLYIYSNGIYVIESKNYGGWIFGSENHKYWTMVMYNYKTKFFNPIWQNKKHISCLSKIVDVPLHSLIVFSERCKLMKLNYDKKNTKIINRQDLVEYLEAELSKNNILSVDQINKIYESLKPYKLKDKEKKQQHIDQIRNRL